jgi:hypothetical protein
VGRFPEFLVRIFVLWNDGFETGPDTVETPFSPEDHVSFVTNVIKRTLDCRDGTLTIDAELIKKS